MLATTRSDEVAAEDEQRQMRVFDTHEVAWAAGFFDGEGYMGLAHQHWRGKCRRQLHAHVSQTDPRPLERFRDAVQLGRVSKRITQPKSHPTWKPQRRWDVSSFEDVQALTGILWNYLSRPKRDQAKAALTAAREWRDHNADVRGRCHKGQ